MIKAGDVVTAFLPGVSETKRPPAVVISTSAYHRARPDVLLALITTQVEKADSAFDAVLFDWQEAGLQFPSAMRSFLFSKPARELNRIAQPHRSSFRRRLGSGAGTIETRSKFKSHFPISHYLEY